jgi:predicted nucleotidyltransferase
MGDTEIVILQGETREMFKKEIIDRLSGFPEVQRVVVFGSFLYSDDPHDLDIAVFQDSGEGYYPLAMKYRRALRTVAKNIPMDVIPIRSSPEKEPFIQEIQKGEVLYER